MAKWKTPRLLESRLEVDRRKRPNQLFVTHVSILNKFVQEKKELLHNESIPWFDPAGAGINARVLFLLQDPSDTASAGTGFISPDNPDRTADNTTVFRNNANLLSQELIHWNIFPWKIGQKSGDDDIKKALPYLFEFLGLLPKLEIVVCMGEKASDGWNQCFPNNLCVPGWKFSSKQVGKNPIIALSCPHPSPQSLGGKHLHELMDGLTPSERIQSTLNNVRKILDSR
ncbi:MAG: uracil-DNA glycosylase [Bacillota bacterium]